MAHLGVHGVREVDGCGTGRERDHPALGREDEDLVLLQVGAQRLHELLGIARLGLPVDHAAEPGDVVASGRGARLVRPVSGDAALGAVVHLPRADLHLHGLAAGHDHRRVQRLVEVELRHRDVVLEAPDDGAPGAVDRAERGVAVLDRLDDDAYGEKVEDLVELAALHDHLLVDAPQVLAPPTDLGLDVQLGQAVTHLGDDAGELQVALGRT